MSAASKPELSHLRACCSRDGIASENAFTLVEVLISLALALLIFVGILYTYTQGIYQAQWSGFSLAAQSLAIQQIEQARSAKWDILDTPVVDELTNLPRVSAAVLNLPVAGTNVVWATNYTTVSLVAIATNPVVNVHMVKVDTVWPFIWKGTTRYFTNTVANYYAPDR